jgi:hypothetical protein
MDRCDEMICTLSTAPLTMAQIRATMKASEYVVYDNLKKARARGYDIIKVEAGVWALTPEALAMAHRGYRGEEYQFKCGAVCQGDQNQGKY